MPQSQSCQPQESRRVGAWLWRPQESTLSHTSGARFSNDALREIRRRENAGHKPGFLKTMSKWREEDTFGAERVCLNRPSGAWRSAAA